MDYENIKKEEFTVGSVSYGSFSIIYLIITILAIYISFKCNNGFDILSFLVAFFCPIIYLIYSVATRGFTLCNK